MKECSFQTPCGTIRYWSSREGTNETVALAFLPGLTADHRLFEKQIAYFEGKVPLLVWDAPGHAASWPFSFDFDLMDKARWLDGIFQQPETAAAQLLLHGEIPEPVEILPRIDDRQPDEPPVEEMRPEVERHRLRQPQQLLPGNPLRVGERRFVQAPRRRQLLRRQVADVFLGQRQGVPPSSRRFVQSFAANRAAAANRTSIAI